MAHARKYSLEPREVPRVQTSHRRIVTRLPVPESLPIFQRLERFEPSSMQGQPPVVIDRTEGWHMHDRWGNMWRDWSSGVLISNIGNSHPAIIGALREMSESFQGVGPDFFPVEYAKRLEEWCRKSGALLIVDEVLS